MKWHVLLSDILDYSNFALPTDSTGNAILPPVLKPKGTVLFFTCIEACVILFNA